MYLFVENLIVIAFFSVSFLLAFLVVLNLYLIKRNGFYISVNCWFCNSWTKVAYQTRNNFDCPSCLQYNGFKKDGSYNKIINAQHNTSFTKYTTNKAETYENGLCTYCNNNQQLKIYQLAKFTPIKEENYDVEVDHFRNQLDKAYKLCKKCQKILKMTIDRQHSWLFGNRLLELRKKRAALTNALKIKETNKKSYFLRFIRYTLIVLSIVILCHTLNIRIVYPNINLNKNLPAKVFNLFKIDLLDFYYKILSTFKYLQKDLESLNVYLPEKVKIESNVMSFLTFFGGVLDTILSVKQKRPTLWKINGLLAWMLLIITYLLTFTVSFAVYICSTKVLISLTLLCYYIWLSPNEGTINSKEYHFTKLSKTKNDATESSDEDSEEEISHAFNAAFTPKPGSPKSFSTSCRFYSPLNQTGYLDSFTAKSVNSTSNLYNFSSSSGSDLNSSLGNLHLGNLNNKWQHGSPTFCASPVKRPILSPAKLNPFAPNSWRSRSWKNDASVFAANVEPTNLSRSSSQSSGFGSTHENMNGNNPFNSLPTSRAPSINDEIDRVSVLSEPTYHFAPISPTATTNGTSRTSTFHPVLNQNSMLFIQNGVPRQNFYASSLRNFDSDEKSVISSSLFEGKPLSPLFKNLSPSKNFKRYT